MSELRDDEDRSNGTEYPFCRVTYWARQDDGSLRASAEGEGWTECRVEPLSTTHAYGTQFFTPSERYQINSLIYLLTQAYNKGKSDSLAEVRRAIGC